MNTDQVRAAIRELMLETMRTARPSTSETIMPWVLGPAAMGAGALLALLLSHVCV